MTDNTLTCLQAAKELGITRQTVYLWLRKGLIPEAIRVGHPYRIPLDVVERIKREGLKV